MTANHFADFADAGSETVIRYGSLPSPIGCVSIAATTRGICAVRIQPDDAPRATDDEFGVGKSNAAAVEDAAAVQPFFEELTRFLDEPARDFRPPLHLLRGTPFQLAVWAELQRIPPGERISYTELAARLGQPSAVRAVAGACAANRIAIAIPCHRIVRSDGTPSGYRWGVDVKRQLLDLEASAAPLLR